MKIAIIGFSGSGKSTLAKKIATKKNIPVLHLDTIHFTSAWQKRDREEAQYLERTFRQQDQWVIEGNYLNLQNEDRFQEADQILFLNFNRFRCFWQAILRFFRHQKKQRDDLAIGSYDHLSFSFLWWILWGGRKPKWTSFYRRIQQQYPEKFVAFSRPHDFADYLLTLKD